MSEMAGFKTFVSGLQRDRRSVERVLNHIRQIQRRVPERDYGPSR